MTQITFPLPAGFLGMREALAATVKALHGDAMIADTTQEEEDEYDGIDRKNHINETAFGKREIAWSNARKQLLEILQKGQLKAIAFFPREDQVSLQKEFWQDRYAQEDAFCRNRIHHSADLNKSWRAIKGWAIALNEIEFQEWLAVELGQVPDANRDMITEQKQVPHVHRKGKPPTSKKPSIIDKGGRTPIYDIAAFDVEATRIFSSNTTRREFKKTMLNWVAVTWFEQPSDKWVGHQIDRLHPNLKVK